MEQIDRYTYLLAFSISSVLALGMALFFFVIAHDYILIGFYNILSGLISNGVLSSNWLSPFETFVNNSMMVVNLMDYIWAFIFISLVIQLFVTSYKSKRQNYPELFGFLFYGTMIFLFISSIFETITNYLYNIFFNSILENLSQELLFFKFYIANYTLINLIIVVICIILNFVDFDLSSFNSRKQTEQLKEL